MRVVKILGAAATVAGVAFYALVLWTTWPYGLLYWPVWVLAGVALWPLYLRFEEWTVTRRSYPDTAAPRT